MRLDQLRAPDSEPVTLAEARAQCRVIDTSEDSLLTLMIGSARRYAESYCNRSLITQRWRQTLDRFPPVIALERGPVQSVQSVTFRDMAGAWQTMPTADYVAELTNTVSRIAPVFGRIWPVIQPQISSVRVDFTAGYGLDPEDVPEGIRQWILVRVASLYEHRNEYAAMSRGSIQAIPFLDRLLDPYVVPAA